MSTRTRPVVRRSLAVAAAVAVAASSVCTYVARAQDKMGMDGAKATMMPAMTADEQKMVMDHMTKMKAMAADPAEQQKMAAEMAKMMVMDHMAMQLAMDPQFKSMCAECMNDENLKKVNADAKKMATDPDQMAKAKSELMADPGAMKMVVHEAMKMHMMQDRMGGMKMDAGKTMDHAKDEMGGMKMDAGKTMDHAKDEMGK